MKNTLVILLWFCSAAASAQGVHSKWEEALNSELEQFKTCEQTMVNGINSCNYFIGQALKTVYKINDFYAPDLDRYMLAGEIGRHLEENKQWTLLGHGYEQTVLKEAQGYANAGKAVVAIYLNEEDIGLVSLILPGTMKESGTWGFQVPNSAAFMINDPEKSYVGKGLSYSFDRKLLKGVMLYGRSY